MSRLTLTLCGFLLLIGGAPAWADPGEPGGTDGAAATDATPPQPTSTPTYPIAVGSVSVPVPEGALEPGAAPVEVVLGIVVTVEGRVSDAVVKESSGIEALDAAALSAAPRLRFLPSTLDGVPIEVTIDYPMLFLAPPVPEPEIPPARLFGRVEVKGSLDPVEDLEVLLLVAEPKQEDGPADEDPAEPEDGEGETDPGEDPDKPPLRARDFDPVGEPVAAVVTGSDGAFDLGDVPAGTYLVLMGSGVYKQERFLEVLEPGLEREVLYRIRPTGVSETVVVARRTPDAPERVLTGEQLRKLPGAGNDPMAAVQSLPGVVRSGGTPGGQAEQAPVLRGAAPEDSVLYLDGLPIPIIYHSISGYSLTGEALVDRAFLKPAAAEARYGDLTGGVVGLELRGPRRDRVGGHIDIGTGLASVGIEGPINEKARFWVGIRRSYFELLLGPILAATTDTDLAVSPYFQDQQVIFELDAAPAVTVRLGYLGGLDGMELLFTPEDEEESAFGFRLRTDLHRFFLRMDVETPGGLTNRLHPALTVWKNEFEFTDAFENSDRHTTFHLADDLHVPLLPWLSLDAGLLLEVDRLRQRVDQPRRIREDTGPRASIGSEENVSGSELTTRTWVGGYLSLPITPIDNLTLAPELRVDYFAAIRRAAPQVRARIGYSPIEPLRFSLAGGRYVQAPSAEELSAVSGNPDLGPEGAWHANLGVNWAPGPWLSLDVQGYYKHLDNQTVSSLSAESFGGFADLSGFLELDKDEDDSNGLDNAGAGRIWGMEVFARYGFKRVVGVTGWLGYSLSWAQRRDAADEPWRWFQFDRRHGVTALLQLSLPGEVTLGARFQYQSGAPKTPVEDSVYYADAGFWVPVYGAIYADRGLPFHQLDLRIDKRFRRQKSVIDIYVEAQNVYASTNGDFSIPSYDYREEFSFTNIPAVNFAARVEF